MINSNYQLVSVFLTGLNVVNGIVNTKVLIQYYEEQVDENSSYFELASYLGSTFASENKTDTVIELNVQDYDFPIQIFEFELYIDDLDSTTLALDIEMGFHGMREDEAPFIKLGRIESLTINDTIFFNDVSELRSGKLSLANQAETTSLIEMLTNNNWATISLNAEFIDADFAAN